MNFKERVRQALRQPNKMTAGGFIKDAGGGDKIVYGATHEQGGVNRGPDVELEGGGFGPDGQPLAGEVITTIKDIKGNNQEFYMSHQNGIAQKYLNAKQNYGGELPQNVKQDFARLNEQVSSEGQPEMIAKQGGMRKYLMGGMPVNTSQDPSMNVRQSNYGGDFTGGEVHEAATNMMRQRRGDINYTAMLNEGGMKEYAGGGMRKNPTLQVGDTVNGVVYQGGDQQAFINQNRMKKYLGGMRKKYEHGGPHKSESVDGKVVVGEPYINPNTNKPWTRDEYYAAMDAGNFVKYTSADINPDTGLPYGGASDSDRVAIGPGGKTKVVTPGMDFSSENIVVGSPIGDGTYAVGENRLAGTNVETQQFDPNTMVQGDQEPPVTEQAWGEEFALDPTDYGLSWSPIENAYTDGQGNLITAEALNEFHNQNIQDYMGTTQIIEAPQVIGGSGALSYLGPGRILKGAKTLLGLNKAKNAQKTIGFATQASKNAEKAVKSSKFKNFLKSSFTNVKNTANPLKGWTSPYTRSKIPYTSKMKTNWQLGKSTWGNVKNISKKGLLYTSPWMAYNLFAGGDETKPIDASNLDFSDLDYTPDTTTQLNIYDAVKPTYKDSADFSPKYEVYEKGDVVPYISGNDTLYYRYKGASTVEANQDQNNWELIPE